MRMAKRILRLIYSGRVYVEIAYLGHGHWGECIDDVLIISKRLCEKSQVTTLIHEALHFLYPKHTERQVLAMERSVFKGLLYSEYLKFTRFIRRLSC